MGPDGWNVVSPLLLGGLGSGKADDLRCIIRRGDSTSQPINGREKVIAFSHIDVKREQSRWSDAICRVASFSGGCIRQ